MNKLHKEILEMIQAKAGQNASEAERGSSYGGHKDLNYDLSRPEERQLAKDFLKAHPDLTSNEFTELLDALYTGESTNEKSIAGLLLENHTKFRKKINPRKIDEWLDNLHGWLQVDSFCQSNFTAKEVLARWKDWETLIRSLNRSKNINKRRASLVLLVKSCRESEEEKLAELALEMIDNVKEEEYILITKAISWLLREMIKKHRHRVENYLDENKETLPAVAIRETTNKLKKGKK